MTLLAALSDVTSTATTPFRPVVVLLLCIIAGIGTIWMLPHRRDAVWRAFGTMLLCSAGLALVIMLVRWTMQSATGAKGLAYVYFWLFATIAIAASFRVITHPKPVYSALYFVLTVFASAGLFLLLWAEFMAAALVLIYAGAILVTYVFVIMLASEASASGGSGAYGANLPDHDADARAPYLSTAVGFALMGVVLFLVFERAPDSLPRNDLGGSTSEIVKGHTQQLGAFLFKYHFVNIQLAGLLLTVAMIGAIMIARKRIVRTGDVASEVAAAASPLEMQEEIVLGEPTPIDDNPHAIPVVGTMNPRQKAYPEN